mgnify:CR=1 FL=1
MAKRKIEVFTAGCPVCDEVVSMVERLACPSCEVNVLNMNEAEVAERAKSLNIKSVPAVAINGELVDCCQGRGPDEERLRAAGLGKA